MKRASIIASGFVFALIAACGGRVDSGSSSTSQDPVPTVTRPQPPPPGSGRGRPPSSVTGASVASQIAETYCKGFSSCCVGAGQPPIDVTRCRQVVASQIEATLSRDAEARAEDVTICEDAIKGRLATCSPLDAPWWTSGTTLALLAPSNVRSACSPIFDLPPTKILSCESNASCSGLAATCAIDECTAAGPIGTACTSGVACLDGESCIEGACSAPLNVQENGACKSDEDCRLGLVCAKTVCLKSRDVPGNTANTRFSPYRIGADTCRAYSTL